MLLLKLKWGCIIHSISEQARSSGSLPSSFPTEPQIQFSTFPARKKVKALEILKRKGKKSLKVKTDRYANRSKKEGHLGR